MTTHENTDGEPFWQPTVDEDLLMSSFDEKNYPCHFLNYFELK